MRGHHRIVLGWAAVLLCALCASTCARDGSSPEDDPPAPDDPPTARRYVLERLREAHEAVRHPSDGGGRAWLALPEGESASIRARTRGRWTIVYEAGPSGIAEGGFVRLTVSRFWDWSPAQVSFDQYSGYTTAECDAEGVTLEPGEWPGFWADFVIAGRALREGERITIVYGAGEALAVADKYAERGSRFWISVDGDGDGFPVVLKDSPSVDVEPGPPAQLSLVLPSTAEPGVPVRLVIAVLDSYGSAGCNFEGEIELTSLSDGIEVPERVSFTAEERGTKRLELEVQEPGVYRILARTETGGRALVGQSNPLLAEANAAPIRWGDLHGHSNLSDGTGTPEDFLLYARDVAALDVVSLTDHDHWGMLFLDEVPEVWEEIQAVTERFHSPGRFVTLLGFEWTNWIHGHRHVLYFEDEGPVLSSIDPDYETPAQLWDGLRGLPALTFAHHSAGGPVATNWDYAPDPELEPVTEVASVHGASEAPDAPNRIYSPLSGNFVRDALDRGYRLGFIGSGDSHDGHPGLAQLAGPSGGGLAALLTDDLSREGVYEALRARRSYATNGPRILLRAALDAHPMGSIISAGTLGEQAVLYVRAIGTAPLEMIDVIRSGAVVDQIPAGGIWDLATTIELEGLAAGEYVYVRVVQTDDGAAWSSPFFFE